MLKYYRPPERALVLLRIFIASDGHGIVCFYYMKAKLRQTYRQTKKRYRDVGVVCVIATFFVAIGLSRCGSIYFDLCD